MIKKIEALKEEKNEKYRRETRKRNLEIFKCFNTCSYIISSKGVRRECRTNTHTHIHG